MKKLLGVLCVLCVLTFLLPGTARAQMSFGFKAYGGLNYLGGGDLSESTTGWNDFYQALWPLVGGSWNGNYKAANLGMNFGGEVLLQFTPNMAVGLGVGYLQASRTTNYNFNYFGTNFPYAWKVSASAIPITASFIYTMPVSSQFNAFFDLGVGYYASVKATQENSGFLFILIGTYNDKIDATSSGFGFHGGLGLEFVASPNFSIFLEAKGRYANIGGFEASETNVLSDWGVTLTTNNAKLYLQHSDWTWLGLGTYNLLGTGATIPVGAVESKIDLSGFSVVLGFIVHL